MRRLFCKCFSIVLIGLVLTACNSLRTNENLSSKTEYKSNDSQQNNKLPINATFVENDEKPEPEKFYCRSKEKLKIWKILKKTDYVKGFLEDEKEAGNCDQYIDSIKHLDLNGDGQDELYVISGTKIHPVSFATIWIYQKVGNTYKEILEERDENYKILKTKTNGFHDLSYVSRRTTFTAFHSNYKYKNGEYQSVKCSVGVPYEKGAKTKFFNCDDDEKIEEFENSLIN